MSSFVSPGSRLASSPSDEEIIPDRSGSVNNNRHDNKRFFRLALRVLSERYGSRLSGALVRREVAA
jgi:hypothetical protein